MESCFVHDVQWNMVHVVTRDIEQRKDEERRRADARAIEDAQDTVQRSASPPPPTSPLPHPCCRCC